MSVFDRGPLFTKRDLNYVYYSFQLRFNIIIIMGQGSSLMLQDEEIMEIAEETGCKSILWDFSNYFPLSVSKNQIVRLYSRFLNLDRQSRGYLDREDFLRIPELAINPLGDRIVDAFFTES